MGTLRFVPFLRRRTPRPTARWCQGLHPLPPGLSRYPLSLRRLSVTLLVRRLPENTSQDGSMNEVLNQVTEDEGGPWTTVTYRRGRSRSPPSTPRQEMTPRDGAHTPLSVAQRRAFDSASAMLTAEQKEQIRRRYENVGGSASHRRSPSPGEGTSWRKGKAIDPREWGAVGIPHDELDPDAQRREFDMYKG
ncbi:hypothetical protein K474DRAFT_1086514 [Panus rudis PR-1116 ss-1]|nr:hypothetical protein K474DRAFT_1086514 [Panus rudis PR-1116 ss-1]